MLASNDAVSSRREIIILSNTFIRSLTTDSASIRFSPSIVADNFSMALTYQLSLKRKGKASKRGDRSFQSKVPETTELSVEGVRAGGW